MVVSDSSPLVSFARADLVWILQAEIPEVWVPPAVWNEVMILGAGRPGADLAGGGWVQQRDIVDRTPMADLHLVLGPGEREAIVLAMETGLPVLLDDGPGRREAQRLGLTLLSSLRVLASAKQKGLIPAVRPSLDALRASDFRLSKPIYERFLASIGEL